MKFSIGQNVAVAPDVAVAAYGNPAFYENRAAEWRHLHRRGGGS